MEFVTICRVECHCVIPTLLFQCKFRILSNDRHILCSFQDLLVWHWPSRRRLVQPYGVAHPRNRLWSVWIADHPQHRLHHLPARLHHSGHPSIHSISPALSISQCCQPKPTDFPYQSLIFVIRFYAVFILLATSNQPGTTFNFPYLIFTLSWAILWHFGLFSLIHHVDSVSIRLATLNPPNQNTSSASVP